MSGTAGERLWRARATPQSLPRDFLGFPTTEDEGYAVQAEMIAAAGLDVVGWKIGATNPSMFELLNVTRPFVGPLFAGLVHDSGAAVPIHPREALETEFTVRLGAHLPPSDTAYTVDEVAAAVAAVIPSFEIIGFRFDGEPTGAAFRMIADGGANSCAVLGDDVTDWDTAALAAPTMTLRINDAEPVTGSPAGLFVDHLFEAVGWVANHPALAGRGLRAGEIVMTGTCTGMTPLQPGDTAEADFGGFGTVRATFT